MRAVEYGTGGSYFVNYSVTSNAQNANRTELRNFIV